MRLLISTTRDQTDQHRVKNLMASLFQTICRFGDHMVWIILCLLNCILLIHIKEISEDSLLLSLSLLLLICFSSSRVRLWISFSSKNPKVNLSWILLKCGSPLEQLISLWDWTCDTFPSS